VSAVGRLVGYESEAAFSRAFTRVIGTSPSGARRAGARGHVASALGGLSHP
jgi:AraC-like DNA-binding protein